MFLQVNNNTWNSKSNCFEIMSFSFFLIIVIVMFASLIIFLTKIQIQLESAGWVNFEPWL